MKRRQFVKAGAAGAALLLTGSVAQAGGKKKADAKAGKINTLVNKNNPTTLEKKHVPLVEAPRSVKKGEWFQVKVKVGFMIEHPSKPDHWIDRVELQTDGKKVSEIVNVAGGTTSPSVCFTIRLQEPGDVKLEAVADCNIHGTWLGEPVHVKVV